MAKYAVSLGEFHRPVLLEAASAQQALDNVIATMQTESIALIPREDKVETHWYSRNTADAKDEILVKNTDQARKLLSKVRSDVVDVFWFVSFREERNSKTRKIK